MGSSQGSSLSTNVAGLVESTAATGREVNYLDTMPVYVKELIAGGAAGAFAKTAVAPLERIKILLQTRTQGFHSLGVYQSLKRLLKHEGLPGFYKGNGAGVLRIVPYAALHFMTYEQYRCWILDNYTVLGTGPVVDLLAGSAAGGTAVLFTYPLDLARTKLAYQVVDAKTSLGNGSKGIIAQPHYSGIRNVLQSVYSESGVRGWYRGLGPTLIGILPYAGLKFYIYEELKRHVSEEYQRSITMRLCCGALAGLVGQTFTYPLDVVRRQMQVENMQSAVSGAVRHKNTWNGITTIVSKQGLTDCCRFFDGFDAGGESLHVQQVLEGMEVSANWIFWVLEGMKESEYWTCLVLEGTEVPGDWTFSVFEDMEASEDRTLSTTHTSSDFAAAADDSTLLPS